MNSRYKPEVMDLKVDSLYEESKDDGSKALIWSGIVQQSDVPNQNVGYNSRIP